MYLSQLKGTPAIWLKIKRRLSFGFGCDSPNKYYIHIYRLLLFYLCIQKTVWSPAIVEKHRFIVCGPIISHFAQKKFLEKGWLLMGLVQGEFLAAPTVRQGAGHGLLVGIMRMETTTPKPKNLRLQAIQDFC